MTPPRLSHLPIIRLAVAALAIAVIVTGGILAGDGKSNWTKFGGPNENFVANSSGLAKSWPADGPPKLWSRELGDGYSAILYEDGRLYTMYRIDDSEAVVALDASSGKTIWEHRYEASPDEGHVHQFGDGPRSTPLLSGNRIYTVGVSGKLHALNKKDGSVAWSKELWGEFGGNFLNHGYSSSPIDYMDTIIVLVGGEDQSIVAFNKKDGSVSWKRLSYENSYSTPKLIKVGGQLQLVTFMATEIIGVDPGSGELLWSVPHENDWRQNVNMPVMAGDILFLSSPQAGARGLKLSLAGDKTEVEEVWSTRKIQFYHVSSVANGDWVYGSTGTGSPSFIAAVNIQTGEIAWRKRGFAKANVVMADGRLIILDEDGKLALATATPEDLTVHSVVDILEKVSWTVPTLVGKTLFLRDKTDIIALDLG
jgi:outer membrane protein assembly factor BamB